MFGQPAYQPSAQSQCILIIRIKFREQQTWEPQYNDDTGWTVVQYVIGDSEHFEKPN